MFDIAPFVEVLNGDVALEKDNQMLQVPSVKKPLLNLDTDVAFKNCLEKYLNNSSPFFSSLVDAEQIELPVGLKKKIHDLVTELNFSENVKAEINSFIHYIYVFDSRKSIEFSKSNDGELIIYTFENEIYRNALFDKDGDIEIIKIPKDKTKTTHKIFFKDDNYNLSNVFRTFNGM